MIKRRRKLLTKRVIRDIPPLYATDGFNPSRKMARLKLFNPGGAHTWYVFEANAYLLDGKQVPLQDADLSDVKDVMFFGYSVGTGNDELGYFCLSEIISYKNRMGLTIERDRLYKPESLAEIKRKTQ